MLRLFSLILGRNIRSILTLFFVLFLASTGFLVMRQLTENVEMSVSRETTPLFGGDIRVSPRGYIPTPIIDTTAPYLSGYTYSWGERTEFSTTLIDREGKTGLINVIAYSGDYPQKGILELSPSERDRDYIAVTEGLMSRFALSGSLSIDGRSITPTHTIIRSSDLGFSFGSDNHLLLLPKGVLSGSMLISSGSRLDQDLLISFSTGTDIRTLSKRLEAIPALSEYRVRNALDREEQFSSTTSELADYILLILVIAAVFALIILRSAHDALWADLARTLRIVETLGFSRRRQGILFLMLYSIVIPISLALSLAASYGIVLFIASFPSVSEFIFALAPVVFAFQVLAILVVVAFLPQWIGRLDLTRLEKYIPLRLSHILARLSLRETVPFVIGIWAIISLIFDRLLWSLAIMSIALIASALIAYLLIYLYKGLFRYIGYYRHRYFSLYDGIRTLVRPLMPTIPITLSLLGITIFFVVFLLFSLSFRTKLVADTAQSANIYAVNVLESDTEKVSKILSGADMYSILRARISRINGETLAEHLGQVEPSGEFTREYNITTDTVSAPVIRGKDMIAGDEVSVDADFAGRLGIDIGDRIEFLLSGKRITLTVASIRKSVRDGFRPFFYFSFEKEAFRSAPKTYFISAYARDTEAWKREILSASGPHVTFVDIEQVLVIARGIATKILSVISLFFGAVSLFGIMAIYSLFGRLGPIEHQKYRLYSLFGASNQMISRSFFTTRATIFSVSYFLSLIVGCGVYLSLISRSSFLTLSLTDMLIVSGVIAVVYAGLFVGVRRRVDR